MELAVLYLCYMLSDATTLLKKFWGFDSFRPPQDDIILQVLNGQDTLALMPTGGGKSICFQVPALVKPGICIVISPLIALMTDQVENLRKKGIKALMVHSGMKPREIDITLDNAAYGDYKFLYVSPERTGTELFLARLKKMKVNLLAVDESHCISQWGYDFRPAYLEIAKMREIIPDVPVLALTATATPQVAADIMEKLAFKKESIIRISFERRNLSYVVRKTENKNGEVINIAKKIPGTGIVYVRSRRKTKEYTDWLQHHSITASAYHAGLTYKERETIQENWIKGKTRVIVATNAFGMGIDKPDVRWVVHLDVPESPEAYFQEAGRGGRDGNKAYAVLLWNNADILELDRNFVLSFPEKETIRRVYIALGNFLKLAVGSGAEESFPFSLPDFCKQYQLNALEALHSLNILELSGYISVSDSVLEPSRVKIEMKHDDLYDFQVRNKIYEPLLQVLLRSYSGVFDNMVAIREYDLAQRLHTGSADIKQKLRHLQKTGVILYKEQNELPYLTYLRGRVSERDFRISSEAYDFRKERALHRLESMRHYIESTHKCRSQLLLAYFGEKNSTRCGHCDYCVELNKLSLSNVEYENIEKLTLDFLKPGPRSLEEILNHVKPASREHFLKAIRFMSDTGIIVPTDGSNYKAG